MADRHHIGQRTIGHRGQLVGVGSQLEGDGTRQAGMPHHKAAIGRGNEQPIVDAGQLTGNLLGKDDTHDEAKAPVKPAAQGADGCHQGDGCSWCLGYRGQMPDASLHHRCRCQCRPTNQHQCHLHGKLQQSHDAAAPVDNHLDRGLVTHGHGHNGYNQCQYDGKDERVGQPTVHHPYTCLDYLLKHIQCFLLSFCLSGTSYCSNSGYT